MIVRNTKRETHRGSDSDYDTSRHVSEENSRTSFDSLFSRMRRMGRVVVLSRWGTWLDDHAGVLSR